MLTEKQNQIVNELVAEFESMNKPDTNVSGFKSIFDEKLREDNDKKQLFASLHSANLKKIYLEIDRGIDLLNKTFEGTNLIAKKDISQDGTSYTGIRIYNKNNMMGSYHYISYITNTKRASLNEGRNVDCVNKIEYLYFNRDRYANIESVISDSVFVNVLFQLNINN